MNAGNGVGFDMANASERRLREKEKPETLDDLNARLRRKGHGAIRRQMEADIEAKSKRKRSQQTPRVTSP
jgi:hypothetical protein